MDDLRAVYSDTQEKTPDHAYHGDVADTLIQSVLNQLNDSRSSAEIVKVFQSMTDPRLTQTLKLSSHSINKIAGIQLSSHNNLLELDLSNNKIAKVEGLDGLKWLMR